LFATQHSRLSRPHRWWMRAKISDPVAMFSK
jgi:hypothetical protein